MEIRLKRPSDITWVYGAHGLIHANTLAYPSVLVLLKREYDSWFVLGALATASAMAFGLLGLPAGYLTDRFGARRVLLLSLTGSALACIAAGLSPGLLALGLSLVALGAFGGFYHPPALALITTHLPKSGRALGMHGVGGNLGIAIAPLGLGIFASLTNWHGAFLLMGAVGLTYSALAAWRLPRAKAPHEHHHADTPEEDRLAPFRSRLPELIATYLIILTLGFVYNGFIAYLPAYLTERSPGAVSGVLAGGALSTLVLFFGVLGQYGGGLAAETSRLRESYLAAAVVVAFGLWVMGSTGGWTMVLAGILASILLFSGQPMGNALLARLTPPGRRGITFGMSFTLSFGVGSLAAGAMGYVADQVGLQGAFVGLGLAALPAVAAGVVLVTRMGPRAPGMEATRGMEV